MFSVLNVESPGLLVDNDCILECGGADVLVVNVFVVEDCSAAVTVEADAVIGLLVSLRATVVVTESAETVILDVTAAV